MSPRLHVPASLLCLLVLLLPRPSVGQDGTAGRRFVQSGLAVLPGLGMQVGYVRPHAIYTAEVIGYVDAAPRFGEGESNLQISAGLGGSIRPLGVVRTIGNADYGYDVDVGVRFGPSLFFTTNATRADKNQQFRLIFDPFLRFTTRWRTGRIVYVELGTLRPIVRLGAWFGV